MHLRAEDEIQVYWGLIEDSHCSAASEAERIRDREGARYVRQAAMCKVNLVSFDDGKVVSGD